MTQEQMHLVACCQSEEITKLDLFAAHALQGLLAANGDQPLWIERRAQIVETASELAETLVKQIYC